MSLRKALVTIYYNPWCNLKWTYILWNYSTVILEWEF